MQISEEEMAEVDRFRREPSVDAAAWAVIILGPIDDDEEADPEQWSALTAARKFLARTPARTAEERKMKIEAWRAELEVVATLPDGSDYADLDLRFQTIALLCDDALDALEAAAEDTASGRPLGFTIPRRTFAPLDREAVDVG